MRVRFFACAAVVAMSIAVAGVPLSAEETPPAADHLSGLRACLQIADPSTRLACYDGAAKAVVSASDDGRLKIVDQAEIRRTRRGLFGFSLPDLGIFGGGDEEPDMEMLETTVASVRYTGSDSFVFRTPEGGLWQVTNAPSRLNEVKVGDPVVLKKASLGSYFVRIKGQLGVKGKRIE